MNFIDVLFTKYFICDPFVFTCISNGDKISVESVAFFMRHQPIAWLFQQIVAKLVAACYNYKMATEKVGKQYRE